MPSVVSIQRPATYFPEQLLIISFILVICGISSTKQQFLSGNNLQLRTANQGEPRANPIPTFFIIIINPTIMHKKQQTNMKTLSSTPSTVATTTSSTSKKESSSRFFGMLAGGSKKQAAVAAAGAVPQTPKRGNYTDPRANRSLIQSLLINEQNSPQQRQAAGGKTLKNTSMDSSSTAKAEDPMCSKSEHGAARSTRRLNHRVPLPASATEVSRNDVRLRRSFSMDHDLADLADSDSDEPSMEPLVGGWAVFSGKFSSAKESVSKTAPTLEMRNRLRSSGGLDGSFSESDDDEDENLEFANPSIAPHFRSGMIGVMVSDRVIRNSISHSHEKSDNGENEEKSNLDICQELANRNRSNIRQRQPSRRQIIKGETVSASQLKEQSLDQSENRHRPATRNNNHITNNAYNPPVKTPTTGRKATIQRQQRPPADTSTGIQSSFKRERKEQVSRMKEGGRSSINIQRERSETRSRRSQYPEEAVPKASDALSESSHGKDCQRASLSSSKHSWRQASKCSEEEKRLLQEETFGDTNKLLRTPTRSTPRRTVSDDLTPRGRKTGKAEERSSTHRGGSVRVRSTGRRTSEEDRLIQEETTGDNDKALKTPARSRRVQKGKGDERTFKKERTNNAPVDEPIQTPIRSSKGAVPHSTAPRTPGRSPSRSAQRSVSRSVERSSTDKVSSRSSDRSSKSPRRSVPKRSTSFSSAVSRVSNPSDEEIRGNFEKKEKVSVDFASTVSNMPKLNSARRTTRDNPLNDQDEAADKRDGKRDRISKTPKRTTPKRTVSMSSSGARSERRRQEESIKSHGAEIGARTPGRSPKRTIVAETDPTRTPRTPGRSVCSTIEGARPKSESPLRTTIRSSDGLVTSPKRATERKTYSLSPKNVRPSVQRQSQSKAHRSVHRSPSSDRKRDKELRNIPVKLYEKQQLLNNSSLHESFDDNFGDDNESLFET